MIVVVGHNEERIPQQQLKLFYMTVVVVGIVPVE